jgi:hypothetical protein
MRIRSPAIGDVSETYHDDWPVARQNLQARHRLAPGSRCLTSAVARGIREVHTDAESYDDAMAECLCPGPVCCRLPGTYS